MRGVEHWRAMLRKGDLIGGGMKVGLPKAVKQISD